MFETFVYSSMNDSPARHPEIRQRLLDSAAVVFTEKGFQAATVREICRLAKANVAAINYHFRDKNGLYSEVLKQLHAELMRRSHKAMAEGAELPAEARFRIFVRSYLRGLFGKGRSSWFGKLILREMAQPTTSLDSLIDASIRPNFERLSSIISKLMGRKRVDDQTELCVFCVIAQCTYFSICRDVVSHLKPKIQMTPEMIDRIADHIIEFSLGAFRHFSTLKGKRRAKR